MFKSKRKQDKRNTDSFLWTEGDIPEIVRRITDHFANDDHRALAMVHTGAMGKEDFLSLVQMYLDQIQVPEGAIRKEAITEYTKYIWGYYILEDLVHDPDISDINILSYDNIRIKRHGERGDAPAEVMFKDKDDLTTFLNHMAVKNKVSVSDSNALQTFTDKDSNPDFILRFSVLTRFVTSCGSPYISIRKMPKDKYTMDRLQEMGMFDQRTKEYLVEKARNGSGILFTGKGASGKTTLMNALLECIPADKRGMVIQENEELFSGTHKDLMFVHVVTNRGEGKINYELQDLAKMGLLMDLDYFVIGEIKGGEAWYFLNAAYTGHKCWASVHGISSTEAMDKLADYALYDSRYSKENVLKMLHYVDTVVFLEDFKVAEISEVTGWNEAAQNLDYKVVKRKGEELHAD